MQQQMLLFSYTSDRCYENRLLSGSAQSEFLCFGSKKKKWYIRARAAIYEMLENEKSIWNYIQVFSIDKSQLFAY